MPLHYYGPNGDIATPESGVAWREFQQTVATTDWTFEHQLNRVPDYYAVDGVTGHRVYGVVITNNKQTITVRFGTARTGTMYLR